MSNKMFKGIMPALITPFHDDGSIKKKTVERLIDWHLTAGVQGFYICGSTGEGPALSAKIRMEMTEIAVAHAKGRGVVIDHIGAPNMDDALALTKHATKTGVDAIASLAPTYFFKYTEDELEGYYKTIAANTGLPVLVYATALMNTVNVARLMEKLMHVPNIIGVKCTIRDYYQMRKIIEINDGDINVINGPDETLLCGLVMGVDGGIGSTYNLMPDWFSGMYGAYVQGDLKTAQGYQYRINRVIGVLIKYGINGVIKSTKAALELMGYDVGSAVSPAIGLTAQQKQDMKQELEACGIRFEMS